MGSILFWVIVATLTLAVTGLMVAALARGAQQRAGEGAAAFDLRVYRDQLKEVERDLARGTIATEEAERLRTEIGRRVLAADQAARADAPGGPTGTRLPMALAIVGLSLAAGFATYALRGSPGLGDQPLAARLDAAEQTRANRPRQAEQEARVEAARPPVSPPDPRHAQLIAQLRSVMAERPNDIQGQELLARNEAMLGNFAAAARAQGMVVALKGPVATAADLAMQAELMIVAAGGLVTPETESVLAAALEKDAANGSARYYSGLLFTQAGRYDLAFRFWAPLWEVSTEADPWAQPLREQLPDIAWLAGQHRYQMPPLRAALPGPDAAALEAAEDLSPEERAQMVRGMVDGLMARLANEGGTAPEWARLIRALGTLGETERAAAIHQEALTRFRGRAADLELIAGAARDAGVAQ